MKKPQRTLMGLSGDILSILKAMIRKDFYRREFLVTSEAILAGQGYDYTAPLNSVLLSKCFKKLPRKLEGVKQRGSNVPKLVSSVLTYALYKFAESRNPEFAAKTAKDAEQWVLGRFSKQQGDGYFTSQYATYLSYKVRELYGIGFVSFNTPTGRGSRQAFGEAETRDGRIFAEMSVGYGLAYSPDTLITTEHQERLERLLDTALDRTIEIEAVDEAVDVTDLKGNASWAHHEDFDPTRQERFVNAAVRAESFLGVHALSPESFSQKQSDASAAKVKPGFDVGETEEEGTVSGQRTLVLASLWQQKVAWCRAKPSLLRAKFLCIFAGMLMTACGEPLDTKVDIADLRAAFVARATQGLLAERYTPLYAYDSGLFQQKLTTQGEIARDVFDTSVKPLAKSVALAQLKKEPSAKLCEALNRATQVALSIAKGKIARYMAGEEIDLVQRQSKQSSKKEAQGLAKTKRWFVETFGSEQLNRKNLTIVLGLGKRYYHTLSHNISCGCSVTEAHEDAAAYVQSYYDLRAPESHDLVARMLGTFTPNHEQLPSPLPLELKRGEVRILKHHAFERYDYNDWMLLLPDLMKEVRQVLVREHYGLNPLWVSHPGLDSAAKVMTPTLEATFARAFRDKLVDLKMQSVLRLSSDPTCVALPQYVIDALAEGNPRTLATALVSWFSYKVTLDKAVYEFNFVERGIYQSLLTEYDALVAAKTSAKVQFVKLPAEPDKRAKAERRLRRTMLAPRFFKYAWQPEQGEPFVWGTVQSKNEHALREFVLEVARREDIPNMHVVFEQDTIKENVLERLAAMIAERRSRKVGMSRAVQLEHDRREVESTFAVDVERSNLKLLQRDLAERRANRELIPQWLKDALNDERRIERGFAKLRKHYGAEQAALEVNGFAVHRTAAHQALEDRWTSLQGKAPKGLIGELAKARLSNRTINVQVANEMVVGDLKRQLQSVAPSGVTA
jgi:hypothetical protein